MHCCLRGLMKKTLALFIAGILGLFLGIRSMAEDTTTSASPAKPALQKALFAMGCFWKSQYVFDKVPGVVKTTVGYAGGNVANPSYQQVCTHSTGHAETVLVEYNPTQVSYRKLLEVFFSHHDPTTVDRQGPDVGDNYRSAIFYTSAEQRNEAIEYIHELEKNHKFQNPIVTAIEPAGKFYNAEDYHQEYYKKNGKVCF